jgi:hypothetical protein
MKGMVTRAFERILVIFCPFYYSGMGMQHRLVGPVFLSSSEDSKNGLVKNKKISIQ